MRPADSPLDTGYLPCNRCRRETPRAILAQHGAMCTGCYERYCAEGSKPNLGMLSRDDKVEILQRLRRVSQHQSRARFPTPESEATS